MKTEPDTIVRPEILVITSKELKEIIESVSERTVARAFGEFKAMLAEQKNYYERLYSVQEIASDLHCSVESVYRYWRTGKLGYGQIKPSEKGSTKAQIDEFRRNLANKAVNS